jgi:hypothetical protein
MIEQENALKVELPPPVSNSSFLCPDQNFETAEYIPPEPSLVSQQPPKRSGCCS